MNLLVGIGLGLALVAAIAALVWTTVRRERNRCLAFGQRCVALGLRRSTSALPFAELHYVGEFQGVRVVAGRYAGGSDTGAGPTTLLLMDLGALPGGHWGAELTCTPPKPWGKGQGKEALEELLTAEVQAAARGIPGANLFPADDLFKGGLQDGVIRAAWPAGWSGLGVRAYLPVEAGEAELRRGFESLLRLRAALRPLRAWRP